MKTLIVDDKTTLGEAVQPGEDEEVLLVRDGHSIALVVPFDD